MRLDGAVGPHHGAPATGSSPGARKYRAKRCAAVTSTAATTAAHCDDEDAEAGVKTLENISNTSSNNNNSSSSSNSLESSRRGASPQHLQQKNQQRSITTSRPKKLENVSQYGSTQAEALETHRKQLCTSLNATPKITKGLISVIAAKMLRVQQSLMAAAGIGSGSGGGGLRSALQMSTLLVLSVLSVIALLPNGVYADDSDNFFAVNSFSMSPETTTPEFDYASRGPKKFGDKCDNTLECGFPGSICDPKKKSCQCTEDLPVTNHIDKCGKEASVNESCFFNEQCEMRYFQTECRDGKCVCRFEMLPIWNKDGTVECAGRGDKKVETYIDPAMIGVLVGMALMFVIICVVLRLFSQARWHENRTIFNTPNPRLMNVSLLRESKLLHGQERRGSRMSVRAPSRQPSMASLRPHSPNPSLGNDSHGSGSNASATSLRSTRSNSVAPGNVVNHERKGSAHHNQQQHHHHQQQQQQQQPLITNITPNPNPDQVTVEIIEPEK